MGGQTARGACSISNRSWFRLLLLAFLLPLCQVVDAQDISLSSLRWREIGPTATGGRVVDLDVHPNNPFHIFVASASGGLWETRNNGTTWKCIFEQEGTLSIGDIAVDQKNPQVIWVGTGEANNQRSAFWGDGIYKSTDGGASWTNMGLPESHHIGRIVIDPANSDVVYVAALGHLYTPNEERGLYKTTDGGKTWERILFISDLVGVCDVVINPNDSNIVYAASYERLRRAWHFDGAGPGSAIHKSTDGGKTWTKLTNGLPSGNIGRIGLAIYPKKPEVLYATVSNQNPAPTRGSASRRTPRSPAPVDLKNGFPTRLGLVVDFKDGKAVIKQASGHASGRGIKVGDELTSIAGVAIHTGWNLIEALDRLKPGDLVSLNFKVEGKDRLVRIRLPIPTVRQIDGEVYRTDDGGAKWVKQNRQPVGGSPAYYYGQIRIDPQNDKRIFVLSIPLYKSTDGGKNWQSAARSVHVDHHALWINPKNGNHILLGNDGGFHISYDGAATWDYVYNLPMAQFYAIGVDMQQPYHVYGGLQDNGSYGGPIRSRSRRGTERFEWHKVGGGDGFYVQVDPNDANTIISESQFGVINRLNRATGERKSIRPPQSDAASDRDRYNWNSPILMSHHDPKTLYFAGNKLFRSRNQGDDWEVISGDLTTANEDRLKGNVPHCTITTVAESKLDKQLLLVGTDDGKVHWTNNGGKDWIDMSDRFPHRPHNWWCTRVEASAHDANVAFVSFSAFREDDFRPYAFMTSDRGKTWTSIATGLPIGPLNVIKQSDRNPDLLFVGSDFGVHVSLNKGKSWKTLGENLPRVSVHDLLIHPRERDLVIGTHGRGIFVMNVSQLEQLTSEVQKKPFHVFNVPDVTLWRSIVTQSISGDRKYTSPNPPTGVRISYYVRDVKGKLDVEIKDSNKRTVYRTSVDAKPGVQSLQWNLQSQGRRGGRGSGRGRGRGGFSRPTLPAVYTVTIIADGEKHSGSFKLLADPITKRK